MSKSGPTFEFSTQMVGDSASVLIEGPCLPDHPYSREVWEIRRRVLDYLLGRGFSDQTIIAAKLGLYVDDHGIPVLDETGAPYVVIPHMDFDGQFQMATFRRVPASNGEDDKDRRYRMSRVRGGHHHGIYGLETVFADAPLIIVEGAFDALAFREWFYGKSVVAAGPIFWDMGAVLDRVSGSVHLFMDNDAAGRQREKQFKTEFGERLGDRLSIHRVLAKDPAEQLRLSRGCPFVFPPAVVV